MFLKNKKFAEFLYSFSQLGFGLSGVRRPVVCLSRLLFNPFTEICLREPPAPAHLKGWYLLARQYKDLKPAQQALHHPIRSQRFSGRFRANRLILTFDGFWFAIPALTFVLVL
jgi:hypothetical protein